MKLNENEIAVLTYLVENRNGWAEKMCFPFDTIANDTEIERRRVRLACRSLRRKGLTEFHTALCDEDGEFCGAGYCASQAGVSFLAQTSADGSK